MMYRSLEGKGNRNGKVVTGKTARDPKAECYLDDHPYMCISHRLPARGCQRKLVLVQLGYCETSSYQYAANTGVNSTSEN